MAWRASMLLLLLASFTTAAEPATRPVDRRLIDDALARLADPEPAARDSGRLWLMGLQPAELPRLVEAAAARPLRPAQGVALREIILYVLTRDALRQTPTRDNKTFLGVRLPSVFAYTADESTIPVGIPVLYRLPGFAGQRFFEEGDVILGFSLRDRVEWVRTRDELMNVINQFKPGEIITAVVQRAGRTFDVPVTLDARPTPGGAGEEEQYEQHYLMLTNLIHQAQADAERAYAERYAAALRVDAD
ncbi:MAG TPA: hypothetical protein VF595_00535 [Tepidisphaeraceae bacterium]